MATSAPRPTTDHPGLTDIHAHLSLNAYLFGRDLRRHYLSGKGFNPLASLSDFKELERGGVRVVWCSHFVPEKDFFKCRLLRVLIHLTRGGRRIYSLPAWDCLLEMIDEIESQVWRSSRKFAVAHSNAELDAILVSGRRAVIHTVEGGHILDGDATRIDILAARGVASFALAHLFPNDLAGHSEGIGDEYRSLPFCPLKTGVDPARGLTPFGEEVVDRLVAHGIIPDITHATHPSRKAILKRVGGRVPVIASHIGVRHFNDVDYNLSDEEICQIAGSGGVIGIIFMPLWLNRHGPANGLEVIWETMEYIHRLTKSWDHVAIGTDFDGFTDPPDDLAGASKLPKVAELLRLKGMGPHDLDKILGGNARRVLRAAWR
jgi:membrane dipeptidase